MKHSKFSQRISDSSLFQTPDCRLKREKDFTAIVVHHTGNTAVNESEWARIARGVTNWLTAKDDNFVSAHFQINRDGAIIQLCDPNLYEAFHAGKSEHWHQDLRRVVSDWNRYAVGIELVGDGNKSPYTPEQYASLIYLTKELLTVFPINAKNIVGHEEISPGRKDDPGYLFDWTNYLREVYRADS